MAKWKQPFKTNKILNRRGKKNQSRKRKLTLCADERSQKENKKQLVPHQWSIEGNLRRAATADVTTHETSSQRKLFFFKMHKSKKKKKCEKKKKKQKQSADLQLY